jgi:release factor glutamine methyltransferase
LSPPRTIGAALEVGRSTLKPHSDTPDLDTQLLLGEALGKSRTWVLTHPEAVLNDVQAQTFEENLNRLKAGEALPYVLGWWEFYTRRFQVSPEVLIPRPETELLVEAALAFLNRQPDRRTAVDIGTGCGCIAVTLAAEIPDLQMVATDIELGALRVARNNACDHDVISHVRFLQSDLLSSLSTQFDLICANLPYIPTDELAELDVAKREPSAALDGGVGGLQMINRLMAQIPSALAPAGRLLLEIGAEQSEEVRRITHNSLPSAHVDVVQDLAGRDRLLVIDQTGTA